MGDEELDLLSKKLGATKDVKPPPLHLGVYVWAWSQYVLTVALTVWLFTRVTPDFAGLLWGVPFGWMLFCTWMIGHDASHNSIFFADRPFLNRLIAFVFQDCLIMAESDWIQVHHKEHHSYPGSDVDGQRLTGDTFMSEMWHGALLMVKYLTMGIPDLVTFRTKRPWPIAVACQALRLYPLLTMAWGVYGAIGTSIGFDLAITTVGLLTHSNQLQLPSNGWRQRQLQNTCDFFPGNWFAELFFAGLNAHGVHHVFPALPRGLHGWASQQLCRLEPKHYRGYRTLREVFNFWRRRVDPPPMAQCIPVEGYYTTKNALQGRTDVSYSDFALQPNLCF